MRAKGENRLPGEMEISRQYGYSRQTVRHALSLLEEEGVIVRVHGSGTYLSGYAGRQSGRIAVLVYGTDEYLYPQLLKDMETVFGQEGFDIEPYALSGSVMREREILSGLLAAPPAGIIMEPSKSALPSPNLDLLKRIGELGIPLVYLHALLPVPENAPCIRDDNEGGAELLVRHLIDAGHRQIAGIFKSDDLQGPERYHGFLSALIRAGCPVIEKSILWYDTENRENLLNGRRDWLMRYIRNALSPCSAIMAYNDEIAYQLIRCLTREGLRVPEDIAVVSFDNSHYCRLSPVSITSLAHERHQMGTAAASALLKLIRGEKARSVRLPWTLMQRDSG